MAAGAALSAKRGETKKSELKGASREMYESMTQKQLREFAATKRKNLPTKKEEVVTNALRDFSRALGSL